jgi:hypothetical protein
MALPVAVVENGSLGLGQKQSRQHFHRDPSIREWSDDGILRRRLRPIPTAELAEIAEKTRRTPAKARHEGPSPKSFSSSPHSTPRSPRSPRCDRFDDRILAWRPRALNSWVGRAEKGGQGAEKGDRHPARRQFGRNPQDDFGDFSLNTTGLMSPRAGFRGRPYAEGVRQQSPGSPQAHPGSSRVGRPSPRIPTLKALHSPARSFPGCTCGDPWLGCATPSA